jgi:Protein of unknown function (DUF4446)
VRGAAAVEAPRTRDYPAHVLPSLALTLGMLALLASVLAIVLATIANRRYMGARRAPVAVSPTVVAVPRGDAMGDADQPERPDLGALPAVGHAIDGRDDELQAVGAPRAEATGGVDQPEGRGVGGPSAVPHDVDRRLDALEAVVARLSDAVARLADPVGGVTTPELPLDEDLGSLPTRVTTLEDGVGRLHDQQRDVAGQTDAARQLLDSLSVRVNDVAGRTDAAHQQLDSLSARVGALAEQTAVAQARTDQVGGALRDTDEHLADHVQVVALQLQTLASQFEGLRDHVLAADPTALRHVAVVRYDAFADVGGRLSHSLAVLDDTDSGFVVTTLAGKSEVRTYVRALSHGEGDGTLTVEERQAIGAARQRAGSRP